MECNKTFREDYEMKTLRFNEYDYDCITNIQKRVYEETEVPIGFWEAKCLYTLDNCIDRINKINEALR